MTQSKRILLADDEPHVRHVMAHKLKKDGYQTVMASDGEEAFAAAKEHRPDLVISDFKMPRLDGLGLCRKLADDPATRDIPIILVTSRDFEIGPAQIDGTAVRRVLNKPFSPNEILRLVREILSPRG
jgi:CheY-like chemotaxis protein